MKVTVKERPILFRGSMVRAILAGRKSQTRRPVKPQPVSPGIGAYFDAYCGGPQWNWWSKDNRQYLNQIIKCPYGKPGDRLWVRESFCVTHHVGAVKRRLDYVPNAIEYKADCGVMRYPVGGNFATSEHEYKWKPSIFLPRYASRILLEITDVRVERLNKMSDEDAIAEGAKTFPNGCYVFEGTKYDKAGLCHNSPSIAFACLYDEIHGAESWNANPWVWALTFRVADAKGGA